MQVESLIKPQKRFEIRNIKKGKCDVIFFDNIKKQVTEIEGKQDITYTYDEYKINVVYRDNLESIIDNEFNLWFSQAKQYDYDFNAKEIRKIRDKLLEESDKNMLIDRLGFEIPENITSSNLLANITSFFEVLNEAKNGAWATYRQQLRDLTKQEGFPYNVKFPEKPD